MLTVPNCILWQRLDVPGHDACCVSQHDAGWSMSGMAVFSDRGLVHQLRYGVELTPGWETRSARVTGMIGAEPFDLALTRDSAGCWSKGGTEIAAVRGFVDIDLGFTPATNTIAIRRLRLTDGEARQTTAAWLDTDDWQIKPLPQQYRKSDGDSFEYRSDWHGFHAVLEVDAAGFVTRYPDLWQQAAGGE